MHDHKLTHGDALGRHKLLGGADRKLPPGQVFGKPSAREAEPCVGELIRNGYAAAEQLPDADLGKSLREGWRAAADDLGGLDLAGGDLRATGGTAAGDGKGSVRGRPAAAGTAAAKQGAMSCNKTEARKLLAPPKSVELGVDDEQLWAQRSKEGIAALAAGAGLDLDEWEFDQVFEVAAAADARERLGQGGSCSLGSFMEARHLLLRQQVGL